MNDLFAVQLTNCNNYLSSEEFHCGLIEPLVLFQNLVQFAARYKRHDKEKAQVIHEKVVHADQERMLYLEHDLLLQLHAVDHFVIHKLVFAHAFDGVFFLSLFVRSEKYLAICSTANDHLEIEVF